MKRADRQQPPAEELSENLWEQRFRDQQESLEEYLREQVSLLRRGAAAEGVGGGYRGPGGNREAGWRRWRPEIYLALSLLTSLALFALLWGRLPPAAATANGAQAVAADPTHEAAADRDAGPAPASPPAGGSAAATAPTAVTDPDAAWQRFLDQDESAARWLRAVSQASELADDAVSPTQKGNFASWADTVAAGTALSAERRAYTRIGLFEYVARREGLARDGRVDLQIDDGEYPAEPLTGLLAELGLAAWFERADPADPVLQTAVVLAWVERHAPPSSGS